MFGFGSVWKASHGQRGLVHSLWRLRLPRPLLRSKSMENETHCGWLLMCAALWLSTIASAVQTIKKKKVSSQFREPSRGAFNTRRSMLITWWGTLCAVPNKKPLNYSFVAFYPFVSSQLYVTAVVSWTSCWTSMLIISSEEPLLGRRRALVILLLNLLLTGATPANSNKCSDITLPTLLPSPQHRSIIVFA